MPHLSQLFEVPVGCYTITFASWIFKIHQEKLGNLFRKKDRDEVPKMVNSL